MTYLTDLPFIGLCSKNKGILINFIFYVSHLKGKKQYDTFIIKNAALLSIFLKGKNFPVSSAYRFTFLMKNRFRLSHFKPGFFSPTCKLQYQVLWDRFTFQYNLCPCTFVSMVLGKSAQWAVEVFLKASPTRNELSATLVCSTQSKCILNSALPQIPKISIVTQHESKRDRQGNQNVKNDLKVFSLKIYYFLKLHKHVII